MFILISLKKNILTVDDGTTDKDVSKQFKQNIVLAMNHYKSHGYRFCGISHETQYQLTTVVMEKE